jgi:predicted helicase
MDPITIAAAITATKTLVKSAKGVQEIAHGLDGLFQAKEQHEQNKSHNPGSSIGEKNKSILQKRAKDDGSETSMSSAAAAVIEQKQLEQQLNDLKDEINRKWPTKVGEKTTWDLILEERKKRIADKKERERKEKIEAEERAEKRKALLFELAKGLAVVAIAGGIGWFLWWAATSGPAVT